MIPPVYQLLLGLFFYHKLAEHRGELWTIDALECRGEKLLAFIGLLVVRRLGRLALLCGRLGDWLSYAKGLMNLWEQRQVG